jgi:hypothetical protein
MQLMVQEVLEVDFEELHKLQATVREAKAVMRLAHQCQQPAAPSTNRQAKKSAKSRPGRPTFS